MKNRFTVACATLMMLLVVTLCSSGCSPKSKLEKGIEAANKLCPLPIEGLGIITSVMCENDVVYYNVKIEDDEVDNEILSSKWAYIKPYMLMGMVNESRQDSPMKTFFDLVLESDVKLVYKFTDKYNTTAEYEITPEDLKKATNMSPDSAKEVEINALIELAGTEEEGVTCHREGNNIVFVCTLDPTDDETLQYIKDYKDESKELILDEIDGTDPIFDICVKYNLTLIFRYVNELDSQEITVSPSEIKARL